jgi:hypothetical protein
MLSTVEAIYYSSWQVAIAQKWTAAERENLVCLLYIFCVQRYLIQQKYEKNEVKGVKQESPMVPFTEDGKEFQRSLRRLHKTRKKPL